MSVFIMLMFPLNTAWCCATKGQLISECIFWYLQFSQKTNQKFDFTTMVPNYVLEWMELNFQYYDGLQPKIRAGIINEHECILSM